MQEMRTTVAAIVVVSLLATAISIAVFDAESKQIQDRSREIDAKRGMPQAVPPSEKQPRDLAPADAARQGPRAASRDDQILEELRAQNKLLMEERDQRRQSERWAESREKQFQIWADRMARAAEAIDLAEYNMDKSLQQTKTFTDAMSGQSRINSFRSWIPTYGKWYSRYLEEFRKLCGMMSKADLRRFAMEQGYSWDVDVDAVANSAGPSPFGPGPQLAAPAAAKPAKAPPPASQPRPSGPRTGQVILGEMAKSPATFTGQVLTLKDDIILEDMVDCTDPGIDLRIVTVRGTTGLSIVRSRRSIVSWDGLVFAIYARWARSLEESRDLPAGGGIRANITVRVLEPAGGSSAYIGYITAIEKLDVEGKHVKTLAMPAATK